MPSKQTLWQRAKKAAGKCRCCGRPRDGASKVYCDGCLLRVRVRARRNGKRRPWVKGGPGRPPLTAEG
jgi:hypothetical protein